VWSQPLPCRPPPCHLAARSWPACRARRRRSDPAAHREEADRRDRRRRRERRWCAAAALPRRRRLEQQWLVVCLLSPRRLLILVRLDEHVDLVQVLDVLGGGRRAGLVLAPEGEDQGGHVAIRLVAGDGRISERLVEHERRGRVVAVTECLRRSVRSSECLADGAHGLEFELVLVRLGDA
jgi:hypothetical protein